MRATKSWPDVWTLAMKRPQFGLRLLLLILALCAVCVSWGVAVDRQRQADRNGQRGTLDALVKYLEVSVRGEEELLSGSDGPQRELMLKNIQSMKGRMAEAKAELERLSE
jgi:hypothetical protein